MSQAAVLHPQTSTSTEVAFCRMLAHCGQAVGAAPPGSVDAFKLHQYVETLEELLLDMENESGARPDVDVLQQYRRHVTRLRRKLVDPPVPLYCLSKEQLSARVSAAQRQKQQEAAEQQAVVSNPSAVQGRGAASKIGATSGPQAAGNKPKQFKLTDYSVQQIERQEGKQEELAGEMVGLAQQLKENVAGMSNQLRQRKGVLDDAQGALEDSAANAKKSS